MFFYLGNHGNHGNHGKVGTADGTGPPDGRARRRWHEKWGRGSREARSGSVVGESGDARSACGLMKLVVPSLISDSDIVLEHDIVLPLHTWCLLALRTTKSSHIK